MTTLRDIRKKAVGQLEEAGCDSARLDVDLLLAEALGQSTLDIILEPGRIIEQDEEGIFLRLLARRIAREPISQILGRKDFWSLTFRVSGACLTPRPDSETLIEAALKAIADKAQTLKILDLGTGSGCLLLSLLNELPNASGLGIDLSDQALAVAVDNATRLGLVDRCDFMISDWAQSLPPESKFDIILCNPPYIAQQEYDELAPDVRDYEPHMALFAEQDGYGEYVRLAEIIPKLAKDGTGVFVEIGHRQGARVREIFQKTTAKNIRIIKDLADRDRCVAFNF